MKTDKIGVSLSLLCAVHCISLPLLFTVAPLMSQSFLADPLLENILLIGSLLIAAYTLLRDYLHVHRRWTASYIALAGFVILFFAKWICPATLEPLMMTLGGLTTAFAYYINWKLKKSCACASR
jgi:hypothetical protein